MGRPEISRVIGIGASAGGVDALRHLVRDLPHDLPAAICVVLHIPANGPSLLAQILDRETPLRVATAQDGEPLERGRVYVAPPDRHLIVAPDRVELQTGPKENGVRPAVDTMLRSLAASHGPRAVAVILSGSLDDGAAGALSIKRAGGTVIVQDPDDALVPGMPLSAMAAVQPDRIVALADLGAVLAEPRHPAREEAVATVQAHNPGSRDPEEGRLTSFQCPECSGALWEVQEGGLRRFRCRVGHAYSVESFLDKHGAKVEAALWTALEVLVERAEVLRRIAARAGEGAPIAARNAELDARAALDSAELIRAALSNGLGPPVPAQSART